MPGSRESAGDTLESLSATGLLLVRVSLLPLLFVFSVYESLLSDLKPYLPLLRSSTSSELLELITSVPTKPIKGKKTRTSGIHKKVKVFKEENYLANWIKVRDFLVCLITTLFRFALGEMTVKETLAFSARVQGVGAGHAKLLLELSRREKEANIKPDPDLDLFMKLKTLNDQEASVITRLYNKVIKMLGKPMKILEVDKHSLMLSSSLNVAVAVNGSRKSNCALKWALERFSDEGKVTFKLLHVRARITTVPTPMGNYIPISQVRDDVATAYKKEMEWKTSKRLLPHKQLCSEKKVEAEIVQIEPDDVPVAISNEVTRSKKGKLHQSKNIDTALEGTRVLAKPSLPEAMNKCFLLIASYLVQTWFGAWGYFAFGEDTKDIITTNLEKLLVLLTLLFSFSQLGMLSGVLFQLFYGLVEMMHAHLLVELHLQVRGIATLNPLMGPDLFLGSVRFIACILVYLKTLRIAIFGVLFIAYILSCCQTGLLCPWDDEEMVLMISMKMKKMVICFW
ncbi:hypothetical protein Sjap_011275 [Stephania japonica]|uniref:Uncharacterized protein n=1 Tax=Stephania japonica TaxID=461633 RepID=A0AAP0JD78_9MAGN